MKRVLGKEIMEFARFLNKPLYVVGGAVRNYLIDKSFSEDVDLSAGIPVEEMLRALNRFGFKILAEYKHTGTIVFFDGVRKYEYASFRREEYFGGEHTPRQTEFTEDIELDARRRDFKCNAVYFDIANEKYVDPLGGIIDIQNKTLDTVISPDKVFKNDGLRLMRLARFAGELNFKPTEQVLMYAEKYSENILEIAPERVYSELIKILQSDTKYPFSDKRGHYTGLKILDRTRVLDKIMPELTEGRNMVQRADFHKYDVLEHSLRSVLYADKSVRLDALLHDVGKPYCMKRDGWYYAHFIEGVKIAEKILKRLKADNQTIKRVGFIIKTHMVDIDCSMSKRKVRKFIVDNIGGYYEQLLLVKQADYRASLEDEFIAPTLVKWNKIYQEMKADGTPFTLKDLKISATDLIENGYTVKNIGKELQRLHAIAVKNPKNNDKEILLEMAKNDISLIKGERNE
ncbi:MAG: HD domain-containing protein [Clostridia bacterium]|nr:HD domain-containing protein [Clostridia bacterium]